MANSTFTYSEDALKAKARTENSLEQVNSDLFDVVERVQEQADDLATILRMNREGELDSTKMESALYRMLFKLNELVDEVETDYQIQ